MNEINTFPSYNETKAVTPDMIDIHDRLMRSIETYREENDQRLARLEANRSIDPLIEEKLERIDHFMDETQRTLSTLQMKTRRPGLEGSLPVNSESYRHRKSFEFYLRQGESDGLRQFETKALSSGSGPDGGYLVPQPHERDILRRMSVASPIRSIASVQSISTAMFKKAFSTTGPQAGWVAETAARNQTS